MRLRPAVLLVAMLGSATMPAAAFDYQIHGFAAQAYLLSDGNNFFGDSTNGSHDFYEAAINGTANLGHGVLASAQGLIRDAGLSDTGKPRLDYALVDWNALQGEDYAAGIRLGRVKNPLGLYNDTRDVVFARPGILMPQSVYFDGVGLRGIFFTSDGAQLYGNRAWGDHDFSFSFTAALNDDLKRKEVEVLVSSGPRPDRVRLKDLFFTQVLDTWDGGRVVIGASHAHARIDINATAGYPLDVAGSFNLYVFSARYNAERFSLTGEYIYTRADYLTNLMGRIKTSSDGGYVQADYRLNPHWSIYSRYDATFTDADDHDGSHAAQTLGVERYSQFAHDLVLGGGWRPDEHWGLWAEVHRIYGTATAPPLDNPGGADDAHWTLMTLMVGYRF